MLRSPPVLSDAMLSVSMLSLSMLSVFMLCVLVVSSLIGQAGTAFSAPVNPHTIHGQKGSLGAQDLALEDHLKRLTTW